MKAFFSFMIRWVIPLLGLIAGTFGLRMAFLWAAFLVGAVFLLAPVLARQRT